MEKHGVVPDVIDQTPEKVLEVVYDDGVNVEGGNKLTPTVVKDAPQVKWDADTDSYYLLCMTDPDAPSRKFPKAREWHHWLIGNIPGNDISKGQVLSEYIGAAPPPDTGFHRYVILVYKQPSKLKFEEKKLTNKSSMGREKFAIRNFAKKYNLGEPIAGNFFQAKYDNYVPTIYKQIGA